MINNRKCGAAGESFSETHFPTQPLSGELDINVGDDRVCTEQEHNVTRNGPLDWIRLIAHLVRSFFNGQSVP